MVLEDKGDLAVEPEALDQVSDVFLPVQQSQDEHFDQDKSCIDCRENALDCILTLLPILVRVTWIRPHRLETNSVRT